MATCKCKRCGIPEAMPGITLKDGLCSFCRGERQMPNIYEPLGMDALREYCDSVLKEHPAGKYEAVVAFSGGRDSTYMLYQVCKGLKLKTLAVAIVNDFVPETTRQNIERTAAYLGADLRVLDNPELNKCSRQCIKDWTEKPSAGPAMLASFCTGCRLNVTKTIPQVAREVGAPLMFTGHTPHEYASYKTDILSLDPDHPSGIGKICGFAKEIIKNPRYLRHPGAILTQGKEFLGFNKYKEELPIIVKPFVQYLRWTEEEMEQILKEVGFSSGDFTGTRRSDCYIAPLRQYLYFRQLGYCDAHCYYPHLVRIGKMTLEEAEQKIAEETEFDPDFIAEILEKFGVDFEELDKKLTRYEKENH